MNREFLRIRCDVVFNDGEAKRFVIVYDVGILCPRVHANVFKSLLITMINSPFNNFSKKSSSFESWICDNSVEVYGVSFFHVAPDYSVTVANAEDNTNLRLHDHFVLVLVLDVFDDGLLVVISPIGVTMCFL